MTIGVVSDIHSNLEALNTVLTEIEKIGVDEIWCLGDVVGYGANPNECAEIIRERCGTCIAGNHDWASLGKTDITYFNPIAKAAIIWTRDELSEDNKNFLDQFELKAKKDDFLLVHSTPSAPEEWRYLFDRGEFEGEFGAFDEHVCLIGHSHIPVVIDQDLRLHPTSLDFDPEDRYIVNIGSVGQPRDGDPRASFAIIDDNRIEIKRIEYDIDQAKKKILKAGLPSFLAERLVVGR